MTPDDLDPLSRLAIRHGSDKFGGHLYTPIYHRLLQHLRDRPVRLLELGVGGYAVPEAGGSSLRMWAEYFPAGRIVGLDFHPKRLHISPRVTIVQGSQADENLLRGLVAAHGPFDIVIDDGSHHVAHVLTSFRGLYASMPAGGIYVVEDTQTAFAAKTGGEASGRGSIYDLANHLVRAMQEQEGFRAADGDPLGAGAYGAITDSVAFHRNMIVFTRGENTYPSNHRLDFRHAEVQAVYRCIAEEAARNPGPRDSLSRIDMCVLAGRPEEAARLALASAAAWPEDVALLAELARIISPIGQGEATAALLERLERAAARGEL
ncbi:MAG TPA: hypothetical protein VND19_12820 [Acetobacteraceae bacterium]|nr:hypothetical protein [Acetobacteraceae bacterium]